MDCRTAGRCVKHGGCPCSADRGFRRGGKEAVITADGDKEWFVYILRCANRALYTGVTTDVQRRVGEHESNGRFSARFTRAFSPVELVYSCCVGAKSLAYQVEYRIKRLPREKKAKLIAEACSKARLLALLNINA